MDTHWDTTLKGPPRQVAIRNASRVHRLSKERTKYRRKPLTPKGVQRRLAFAEAHRTREKLQLTPEQILAAGDVKRKERNKRKATRRARAGK